jgi:hypothetical protein
MTWEAKSLRSKERCFKSKVEDVFGVKKKKEGKGKGEKGGIYQWFGSFPGFYTG